jgi:hypothetical protein
MFLFYFVGAVIAYQRTMSRPWPKVPPIDDWDDEW